MTLMIQLFITWLPILRFKRGQTMSEYALILAAIAVVAFGTFVATGNSIEQMVSWTAIDHDLLGS